MANSPKDLYFFNTYPYNELEKDNNYKVNPEEVLNFLTLDRQAQLIVDMNRERDQLVATRIQAWKAHFADASRNHYVECQECYDLFSLGGSIISHLMVEYKKREGLPWNELLHSIVHGLEEGAGLKSVDLDEQYDAWAEWFEKLYHDEAPRWVDGKRVPVTSGPRLPEWFPVGE